MKICSLNDCINNEHEWKTAFFYSSDAKEQAKKITFIQFHMMRYEFKSILDNKEMMFIYNSSSEVEAHILSRPFAIISSQILNASFITEHQTDAGLSYW